MYKPDGTVSDMGTKKGARAGARTPCASLRKVYYDRSETEETTTP